MTLPGGVDRAVSRYRSGLRELFGDRVLRIVVFGSMARGEASEDSDVDVLVLMESVSSSERNAALDLAGGIAIDSGVILAPLVLAAKEWRELEKRERRLPVEVARDGVEV